MKHKFLPFIGLLLLLRSTYSYSYAMEELTPIDIHGFMTTGIIKSDNSTSYQNGIEERISYTYDSRLGLNISKRINAQWDLASQYISYFGPARPRFTVDWATANYYPCEHLSLRMGKHKLPNSLISDYDGVGKLYPWVRPPQELYSLYPVRRFHGAILTYTYELAPFDTEWSAYTGAIAGKLQREQGRTVDETTFDAHDIRGFSLAFLRREHILRLSYAQAYTSIVNNHVAIDRLQLRTFAAALKTEWKPFLLYAEYLNAQSKIDESEILASDERLRTASTPTEIYAAQIANQIFHAQLLNNHAYYATLGYFVTENTLLTYTHAALHYLDKRPSASFERQQSHIVGVKFDLNSFANLKLEYQKTLIPEGSSGLYTHDPLTTPTSALKKHINIINASLDFVF